MRALLARYKGKEVDTAGDGFFATFDGPVRALRCAKAIIDSVRNLGIEVRAGLHIGECEAIDDKVGGLAVNIGSRICALAGPSEILTSQTIRDLVAGSGLRLTTGGLTSLRESRGSGGSAPWGWTETLRLGDFSDCSITMTGTSADTVWETVSPNASVSSWSMSTSPPHIRSGRDALAAGTGVSVCRTCFD